MKNIQMINYFLVSFYLINTGLLFIVPVILKNKKEFDIIKPYIQNKMFSYISGIAGLILGVYSLIKPISAPVILGDLLPAIVCLLASLVHLLGHIRYTKSISQHQLEEGKEILSHLQVPIGFLILLSGILHVFLANWPVF